MSPPHANSPLITIATTQKNHLSMAIVTPDPRYVIIAKRRSESHDTHSKKDCYKFAMRHTITALKSHVGSYGEIIKK